MKRILWAALAAGLVVGCAGPEHLSERFGVSERGALARQAQRPAGQAPATAVQGLDSQEAAIVAEGYRRSLAPKGASVEEQPVVYVQPGVAPAGRPLPPPSVPQGK